MYASFNVYIPLSYLSKLHNEPLLRCLSRTACRGKFSKPATVRCIHQTSEQRSLQRISTAQIPQQLSFWRQVTSTPLVYRTTITWQCRSLGMLAIYQQKSQDPGVICSKGCQLSKDHEIETQQWLSSDPQYCGRWWSRNSSNYKSFHIALDTLTVKNSVVSSWKPCVRPKSLI